MRGAFLYPIDRTQQPGRAARGAESRFVREQMLSRAVRGKVKNKGKLKGERASISCKSPRLCRVRPTVGSKGICLVTFGAKVTKTWGWEYERVWQRLSESAAQAILQKTVS